MATMKSRLAFVSSILTCRNCMKLFDGKERFPKLLDCLHTICEQCVRTLVNQQSQVKCTICKVMRQMPSDGFPDNELVLNYLQNMEDAPSPRHQGKCQSCSCNEAVAFCEDWGMNVCKVCIELHNLINITRIREVENHLNEFLDKQLTLRNKCQHTSSKKRRFLTMFHSTRKSQMAACSKCSAKIHTGINVSVDNQEGHQKDHNKLMGLVAEQCRERSRAHKASLPALNELIVKVDIHREEKEKDIDETFKALVDKLYEQCEVVKTEVQKKCDARKRDLEDQKSQVISMCAELEGAIEFAEQLGKFSGSEEHLNLQQQVTVRMKELIERDANVRIEDLQHLFNDDTEKDAKKNTAQLSSTKRPISSHVEFNTKSIRNV
ncbi:E3 ubiquitin-protein ligase TRIM56-like [Amphiura filiformis]|uniref:E3 ubiquitin-protein ligase TRIM56-like n=1 Tax=Amphiura filiformis TaxID=82378 RepID=UPI003B22034E